LGRIVAQEWAFEAKKVIFTGKFNYLQWDFELFPSFWTVQRKRESVCFRDFYYSIVLDEARLIRLSMVLGFSVFIFQLHKLL